MGTLSLPARLTQGLRVLRFLLISPTSDVTEALALFCLTIVRTKKRFKEFLLLFSKEPARLENALIGDLKGHAKICRLCYPKWKHFL